MLRRLGKFAVVVSLVCVVAGHWTLLQSFAWVSMTIHFSRTDPLDSAIEKTFSGQNPCELCHFVAEGKKSERSQELEKPAAKLDFIFSLSFVLPTPAEHSIDLTVFQGGGRIRTDAPPSPPPRLA